MGGHQSLDADLDWRLRQLETDLMKIPKQSPATTTTNNLFAPENDLAMELRHLSESDILDPNSTNPGLAPNAILLCLLFVNWKRPFLELSPYSLNDERAENCLKGKSITPPREGFVSLSLIRTLDLALYMLSDRQKY